jgi:hypothetical protein
MNNKYIKYAAIAGGVLLVLYFIKQKGKGQWSGGGNGGGGSQPPKEDTSLPYAALSDDLFNAMNGYGTNESKIYEVLRLLNNKSQWDSLVNTYGVRKLSSGRGNVFNSDFNGNLPNSLKNELDSGELKTANSILSKIGVSI